MGASIAHLCHAFLLLAILPKFMDAARSRFDSNGLLLSGNKASVPIPDWLFSMKDTIIAGINTQSWHNYTIDKGGIQITLDHMQVQSFEESAYDLHLERDKAWIDFKDLKLSLRIHVNQLCVLGQTLLPDKPCVGDTYIDADVRGGLRAGWELQSGTPESGMWVPICSCDASTKGLPELDVDAKFHLNMALDWVGDYAFPYLKPIVQYIVCHSVKLHIEEHRSHYIDQMQDFYRKHEAVAGLVYHSSKVIDTVRHRDENCWLFGCRGGPCAACGTGFCCRKRSFRGGCDGASGHEYMHVCVAAPPAPRTPMNLGKECWNSADCRSGRCGYCGSGSCCRMGSRWAEGPCDGKRGGKRRHECVAFRVGTAAELPEPKVLPISKEQEDRMNFRVAVRWNPDVVCAGQRASDRADWLVKNNGSTLIEAQDKVMSEFPSDFPRYDAELIWNPDASCDGQLAANRAAHLVKTQGLTLEAAQKKVMSEFPALFHEFPVVTPFVSLSAEDFFRPEEAFRANLTWDPDDPYLGYEDQTAWISDV